MSCGARVESLDGNLEGPMVGFLDGAPGRPVGKIVGSSVPAGRDNTSSSRKLTTPSSVISPRARQVFETVVVV
jgi:hypothetical protein